MHAVHVDIQIHTLSKSQTTAHTWSTLQHDTSQIVIKYQEKYTMIYNSKLEYSRLNTPQHHQKNYHGTMQSTKSTYNSNWATKTDLTTSTQKIKLTTCFYTQLTPNSNLSVIQNKRVYYACSKNVFTSYTEHSWVTWLSSWDWSKFGHHVTWTSAYTILERYFF
jgi:hypothetical protein